MAQVVYPAGTSISITGFAVDSNSQKINLANPPLAVPFPGDANHDNIVDVGDLGILGSHYGQGPTGIVPEPCTLSLLLLGGLALTRRRGRAS